MNNAIDPSNRYSIKAGRANIWTFMMISSWKNPLVSMFFCKNISAVWWLRKRPIIGVGLMLDQGQSMLAEPDYPAITPCSPNSKPKWRASPSVRMLPCDDLPLNKKIEYISIAVNKQRERDVAHCLERGALPMSLPVARFRTPLGAGFSEKYHDYPISILRYDVVSVLSSHASLDSGANEYLVGQRWQCVGPYDKFNAPKLLQNCMLSVE